MPHLDLTAAWHDRDSQSLLWLASYPRSGNTFTRILLANYFVQGQDAYNINKLHDFIPADTSHIIWEGAAIGMSSGESSEAIWKARSSVIEHYRKTKNPASLTGLKTHTANVRAFGVPGFNFHSTDRALYIVRHPLDVVISLADFNAQEIGATIDMMTRRGFTLRTDKIGGLDARGSWAEHVTSWTASPPCPLLLVRYEELLSATEITLRAILQFLNAPIIDARINRAVAASRFEKLREQEVARRFVEHPIGTHSGRFFREGKALQWLRKMSPDMAYRMADACEETMVPLGYTHPRDVFFDGRNALDRLQLRA